MKHIESNVGKAVFYITWRAHVVYSKNGGK